MNAALKAAEQRTRRNLPKIFGVTTALRLIGKKILTARQKSGGFCIQAAAQIFGVEVLDFTGAEFEIGLPVEPINLADFAAEEILFVAAMIEPTIKIAGTTEIVKRGAAVLGRQSK